MTAAWVRIGEGGAGVEDAVAAAAAAVGRGGWIVFPTETFYGLAAAASDERAIDSIAAAKGREAAKAMPLIVASMEQARSIAHLPPELAALAEQLWPGPLTLALPARVSLPDRVRANDGTLGIRVSAHPFARALAAVAGPITATSANVAGAPPVARAEDVGTVVTAAAALVIDGGATPGGAPSTVVGLRGGRVVILRAGATPASALRRVIGYEPEPA